MRFPAAVAASLACLAALPAAASAATETHTFRTGPIAVGPYSVQQDVMSAPHPDLDGYVTRMEVDVVDESGKPIPIRRLMLHHIVFLNLARPDATCDRLLSWDNRTSLPARERFYAAGEERAKLVLPEGYGYRIDDSDPWLLLYMLMNHRSKSDRAYIQYTVTTDTDPSLEPVDPYWLDVRNCRADPIYNVPGTGKRGSTHSRSKEFTFPAAGRLVAGGGHVHGGARMLRLTEPGCDDRELARSEPTWGLADHPFYKVRPVLHEPGPINMSAFSTRSGIPIAAGERLRLSSLYDNSRPHVRVMGIMVVYLAADAAVTEPCGALPSDVETLGSTEPGRGGPVPFRIPLTGLNEDGEAQTISRPPGRTKRLGRRATVEVEGFSFEPANARIQKGRKLRWRFGDTALHNVTLANGPVGIGSPNLAGGGVYAKRLRKAGTYRFFCSLHPVQMAERVVVERRQPQRGPSAGPTPTGAGQRLGNRLLPE